MNLGQIYTRRIVADFMVGLLDLRAGSQVLDPCFGHGVFVDSLLQNTSFQVTGVEIDRSSFESYSNPDPKRCTLLNGDFFDIDERYDGIIMNPPYVRQEEIGQLAPMGISKPKLQSACGLMPISSKANLYMYFVLRAVLLLKPSGQLVAIFPNSWQNTPVGKQFADNICHYASISRFIQVNGEAFEGKPMVDVCILKIIRGGHGGTTYQELTVNSNDITILGSSMKVGTPTRGLIRLETVANVRRGITTGCNNIFINPPLISRKHQVGILSSPKNVRGYSTRGCRQDLLLQLGPDDQPDDEESTYINNCRNVIRRQGSPLALLTRINSGKKWYTLTIPEKAQVVFAYIVRNDMKFILNDGACNVRDNFYMITWQNEPHLLMALLNNYHVYCQLEKNGKSYGKGLLKLQAYDIANIMVPPPSTIDESDRNALVSIGRQLAHTGDSMWIDKATEILDKYYGNGHSKENWIARKNKRLNQKA